jgi:predicted nucleic acid-binding protein
MNWVIDASVLIKFFIPEILSEKAEELNTQVGEGSLRLLAPDLIFVEAGTIIWKKHRMKELIPSEAKEIIDAIVALPLEIVASKALMPLAVDIGLAYGITVYDALYVSVAKIHESILVTADRKLVEVIGKTDFKKYVGWLGNSLTNLISRQ